MLQFAICYMQEFNLRASCIFVSSLMADLWPSASMTSLLSPPGSLTSAANRESAQCLLSVFIYEHVFILHVCPSITLKRTTFSTCSMRIPGVLSLIHTNILGNLTGFICRCFELLIIYCLYFHISIYCIQWDSQLLHFSSHQLLPKSSSQLIAGDISYFLPPITMINSRQKGL